MIKFENKAKLACAYGGMVWGVFWIPLRALDDAGISDVWATVVFYFLPLMALVPLILYRWRHIIRGGWRLQLIGFFAGFSMVLYSNAFLYTEVVRAILLYYLCPIWGTLLARIFLKESIIPIRILSICLGMAGMLVIFGADVGVPWPKYAGDWISLSSGIIWAIAMVLMRNDESNGAIELTTTYFIWGTITAVIIACLPFFQRVLNLRNRFAYQLATMVVTGTADCRATWCVCCNVGNSESESGYCRIIVYDRNHCWIVNSSHIDK